MPISQKLFFFIKLGSAKNIDKLQSAGELYLNTIEYFRDIEKASERQDKHEGISEIKQIDWMRLEVESGKYLEMSKEKGNLLSGQFRSGSKDHIGNIYCMTALTDQLALTANKLDPRMIEFGEKMLIITDTDKFLKRLSHALERTKLNCRYGFVEYYDESEYSGELSILNKPIRFKHQNEWRIHIETEENEPYKLYLGNLEDISTVLDSNSINTLRFGYGEPAD